MSAYLLDTGILLRHLRGQKTVVHLLREIGSAQRLAISVITRAEVCAGIRQDEEQVTRHLLARLETLPADQHTADWAGLLIRRARSQERSLQLADAFIAGAAIQHNLTLVTLNPTDFRGLGLSLYPLPDELAVR
ncbi:MAG: PIN domain-containing protein [Anaerolineae bacterium]|nr:PIN domain-containing protein [Anaerolineae bacterium]